MKTMRELSSEVTDGLVDLYNNTKNVQEICNELSRRIEEKKEEVLIAWYAEHGFAPGKAAVVYTYDNGMPTIFIREQTPEEEGRIK